jgi:hypothetical protein
MSIHAFKLTGSPKEVKSSSGMVEFILTKGAFHSLFGADMHETEDDRRWSYIYCRDLFLSAFLS